jgi:hypothetical protein
MPPIIHSSNVLTDYRVRTGERPPATELARDLPILLTCIEAAAEDPQLKR